MHNRHEIVFGLVTEPSRSSNPSFTEPGRFGGPHSVNSGLGLCDLCDKNYQALINMFLCTPSARHGLSKVKA